MNLYIKQRVFSFKDKFFVYDEFQNVKYYIESELFTIGKKFHLYDALGNECAFIHQRVLSLLPRYYISKNGSDIALVTKKIAFATQKYEIDGLNWTVSGDFFAHDYIIRGNGGNIAFVKKKWLSWGDTYEINIINERDIPSVLAVIIIIDAALARENRRY